MFRLLLGMLVGAAAAASYMNRSSRSSSTASGTRALGRVDELSPAARNPVADPALDAGDGTPRRNATAGV